MKGQEFLKKNQRIFLEDSIEWINQEIEKIEGNGLGLAIVKNMVYSINGKINIESEVGLGTKIVLEFPLL